MPNEHVVEPVDPEHVSWQNALMPKMGFLAEGDVQSNAFIFALGLAIVFIVLYMLNKLRAVSEAFKNNKKQFGSVHAFVGQVSDKISDMLGNSDISNHVA